MGAELSQNPAFLQKDDPLHSAIEELPRLREKEPRRELLVVGHTYQPHRESFIPSTGKRLFMAESANELINEQVYAPIFEDANAIPNGVFLTGLH